ncbi:hypothetical protein SOVF_109080, partial [Spinacia oleracea]
SAPCLEPPPTAVVHGTAAAHAAAHSAALRFGYYC